MQQHQNTFNLRIMARLFHVSLSGYHAWKTRKICSRTKQNNALITTIKQVHEHSRGSYGSPRVKAALEKQGLRIGKNRVARLMRQHGVQGKTKCRRPRNTPRIVAEVGIMNVLNRQFNASKPNQKWVTDITYLPTIEGWLYLAVVQDLFSRRIVGWAIQATLETCLVLEALKMAWLSRKPQAGLVHHSDQGAQYNADEYVQALARLGVVRSMSRRGNCWDNAVCESFFATLKLELGLGGKEIWSQEFTKGVVFERRGPEGAVCAKTVD